MTDMDEHTCPECLGPKDDMGSSICEECIDEINEEEDRLEREHIANETFQFHNQLL